MTRSLRLHAVAALLLCGVPWAGVPAAQDVPLEYRVKAGFLFNFVKFVEWPARAPGAPFTICVAGRNPFGDVLEETLRNETVDGHPLQARQILEPQPGCDVLFVPTGAATSAYLRAARGTPTLTVGESREFQRQGGIITFVLEGRNVRFEIDPEAAQRNGLRVSSRLLRLAVNTRGER